MADNESGCWELNQPVLGICSKEAIGRGHSLRDPENTAAQTGEGAAKRSVSKLVGSLGRELVCRVGHWGVLGRGQGGFGGMCFFLGGAGRRGGHVWGGGGGMAFVFHVLLLRWIGSFAMTLRCLQLGNRKAGQQGAMQCLLWWTSVGLGRTGEGNTQVV